MADETKLTVGACMAAAAVMSVHGHPETRGRLSALLVAEAERLADLNPPETEPETETEEIDR